MRKKGSEKYYIIISIILGIIVLGLSMYFIFHEYFTKSDLDREACRQSIILRSNLVEVRSDWTGVTFHSFKNDFPLECKTQVINVDKKDLGKNLEGVNKIIGDAMAECWALFDNGDSSAFPSAVLGANSVCVPCARIHLTEGAKEELGKTNERILIKDALDSKMEGRVYSYWTYLNNSGKKFPAFNIGSVIPFDLESENFFRIEETNIFSVIADRVKGIFWEDLESENYLISLVNRINGASISAHRGGDVFLPKSFDAKNGDLIINYGIMTISGSTEFGNHVPYLFYFQQNQENPTPFEEFNKGVVGNVGFCENWEGIPA